MQPASRPFQSLDVGHDVCDLLGRDLHVPGEVRATLIESAQAIPVNFRPFRENIKRR